MKNIGKSWYSVLPSYRSDSNFISSPIVFLYQKEKKGGFFFFGLGFNPGSHVWISYHVPSIWNNFCLL